MGNSYPDLTTRQDEAEGLADCEQGKLSLHKAACGTHLACSLERPTPYMCTTQEFFSVDTPGGASLGSSRAVAAFRGVVAVGTSSGIVGVLMPRGLSADGHPSG